MANDGEEGLSWDFGLGHHQPNNCPVLEDHHRRIGIQICQEGRKIWLDSRQYLDPLGRGSNLLRLEDVQARENFQTDISIFSISLVTFRKLDLSIPRRHIREGKLPMSSRHGRRQGLKGSSSVRGEPWNSGWRQ